MAAPTFTTWAAYSAQLRNLLVQVETGFLTLSSVQPMGPDGVAKGFRSLDELRRYIDWVDNKVVIEAGATDKRGRRIFCGGVQ
jgi:hypothetical protein